MPSSSDALRVVIADDHQFFRDGLRGTLQEAGMEVVAEGCDGEEALTLSRELEPDVLVLDLNMPGASGMYALEGIAESHPHIQVVVLTVSSDDADVLDALAAGAAGYLLKDTPPERLAAAIRQAGEGDMILSSEVAQALVGHVRAQADTDGANGNGAGAAEKAPEVALTPREHDVLALIVKGADNVEIGRELSISPHTVKQYVTNIFEKLGVRSRVQAAVYAVRSGIV